MDNKYLKYFLIIGLTLFLVSLIFPFIVNCFFDDWQISGTFGDTYGALNALFSGLAFAGIIITILIQKTELENQRAELRLQRTEMQDTRKEFLLNRMTNLIYNQLERFEKSISNLIIMRGDEKFQSHDAISFLKSIDKPVFKDPGLTKDQMLERRKQNIIRQLKIYSTNKIELEKFAHNSYNSIEVLKNLIFKSTLNIEELNDLKNLFFENIGFITMGVVENISNIATEEINLLEVEDYEKNNLDVGVMMWSNIFLKPIVKFYRTRLSTENFEELKREWKENMGGLA